MITSAIGFSLTAVIYGILGGAVILYMGLTSRESREVEEQQRPELWHSIKSLFVNRKFWIAGLANAFYSAAMSLVLASVPFYVKYALNLSSGQSTFLLAAVLVIAIGSVAVWSYFVRRFTLMPVWRAALLSLALAFIPLNFANSLWTAVAFSALIGFGFAGVITTMDLIGAKIMDEDTARYNLRREGIISSAMGFMNRLNGLFTSFAFLLVRNIYGYVSGDVPGLRPADASRFLMAIFPLILMVISFGFSFLINFIPAAAPAAARVVVEEQ
jgi:GPH family glycoside/pentoside/hexuronide:cation symporter